MKKHGFIFAALMLLAPTAGFSAGLPWYAGFGGGVSSLRPETQNSPFTLDSSISAGVGGFLGYDMSDRISLEVGYSFIGSASMSSDSGETKIGYSALSAGTLLYLYGNANDIAQRNGFSGFLRIGLNLMDNSATIPLEREDNLAILAGVGFEWPFAKDISLRAELTSFDGDAQAALASVVFRPNYTARRRAPVVARTPPAPQVYREPVQQPDVYQAPQPRQQQPIARAPQQIPQRRPEVYQAPTQRPQLRPQPRPQQRPQVQSPGLYDKPKQAQIPSYGTPISEPSQFSRSTEQDNCATPMFNEPTDLRGCPLFSGKQRGVEFVSGTATLMPIATQLLDRLAQNLQRYSTVTIEIQAHTESFGSTVTANQIAKQRTIAVARHLAKRGVPVQRLRARAFGHTQPVALDNTIAGRRKNNRIVLRIVR